MNFKSCPTKERLSIEVHEIFDPTAFCPLGRFEASSVIECKYLSAKKQRTYKRQYDWADNVIQELSNDFLKVKSTHVVCLFVCLLGKTIAKSSKLILLWLQATCKYFGLFPFFILNFQGILCSAWALELTQTSVRSRARLTKSSGNLAGSRCWRWEKGTSCAARKSHLKCGPRTCLR